jgi:uncharacterized damage-inducible protein DinB
LDFSVQRMFEHLHWANLRILQALEEQPNDQAIRLFSHTLLAERVWLTRLVGKESHDLPIWSDLSLDNCRKLLEQNHGDFSEIIKGSTDDLIVYQNSTGEEFSNTKEDILIHVALHGQYHRGQINLLLRQNAAQPTGTDYIIYKRG